MKKANQRKIASLTALGRLLDLTDEQWRELSYLRKRHHARCRMEDVKTALEIGRTMAEIIWPEQFGIKGRKDSMKKRKGRVR